MGGTRAAPIFLTLDMESSDHVDNPTYLGFYHSPSSRGENKETRRLQLTDNSGIRKVLLMTTTTVSYTRAAKTV